MDTMTDMLTGAGSYQPAVVALVVLCLAVLVQSFLAGILGLAKSDEVPGRPLKGDHPDFSFRVLRTYGNSTENLPAFGFTLLAAILVGAPASWVNWLAGIHVALRMVYWFAYYKGLTPVGGGPRSLIYVAGWAANLVLALVVVYALIS